MISSQNICLLLFATIISLLFISCSDDGPVQTEENQLELDSELIGTWEQISRMKEKLVIKKKNSTEGFGYRITQDKNDQCENELKFYQRRDFRWTQTKKTDEDWSVIYYADISSLECDGAERNSLLAYEKYYNIEGDTLYFGTTDYSKYVRVE
jgi:hypothetical protein